MPPEVIYPLVCSHAHFLVGTIPVGGSWSDDQNTYLNHVVNGLHAVENDQWPNVPGMASYARYPDCQWLISALQVLIHRRKMQLNANKLAAALGEFCK